MIKNTILRIVAAENKIATDKQFAKSCALPENCYLLGNGEVLCYPRSTGDSRYPYAADGFTLWAYASGEMSLNESTFYAILPFDEGKEPYIAFFGGLPDGELYKPVSVTGVARAPREKFKRYTYFTPAAVYYITETADITYYLRAFVSAQKQAVFSLGAINKTKKSQKTYLSSFFNCLFMHQTVENVETKWFKQCRTTDNGFVYESVEDLDRTTHLFNYGVINRSVQADVDYCEHTTSRSDCVGGKTNSLGFATPLQTGHYQKRPTVCQFGDTAAAGDIYAVTLEPDGCARIDYTIEAFFDRDSALSCAAHPCADRADELLGAIIAELDKKQTQKSMLRMEFGDFTDQAFNGTVFSRFVENVVRQTGFAALAKNSGASMLGVRDVTQQIEAALMWSPAECRAKLIEMLSFLDPSGRAPRQYSLPAPGALPRIDTREFVDQGNWIISCLHTYLSFTNDYSILNEQCGFYKIIGRNAVAAVEERSSVMDHLVRITDFLVANTDKTTHCLHALYGDWNDALDGLGVSRDPSVEFGTGVSVMASLHLYANLGEMISIINHTGTFSDRTKAYSSARELLKAGLQKYAVQTKDGRRKIVHGWGEDMSYFVGSFCDVDGKERDGLTANAFWITSGAYLWDTSIKKDILFSYDRLDSKYGLKTFEPYFAQNVKGVGRIVNIPKGTAENAATYVHAAMFGIWSLFGMGEAHRAWEQLKKVLPIGHELITTSPFIMSNSYSLNEDLGLDGESMSDWFTGSANALIKALVWHVFGIRPDLDGVKICPPSYAPFKNAKISICVKDKQLNVELCYCGKRTFELNGKPAKTYTDQSTQNAALYIDGNKLNDGDTIKISY